jgi:hypothetical protein
VLTDTSTWQLAVLPSAPQLRLPSSSNPRTYLNPPDAAVVLCVDEKSHIQALDRTAPILPGTPERATHDYKRNGTTNLYAALDVASGHVIADMTPRHRVEEFRRFLNLIDTSAPDHLDGRARPAGAAAFGLKPHQTEAFKLSPDPQFIDKVRDIVGLLPADER